MSRSVSLRHAVQATRRRWWSTRSALPGREQEMPVPERHEVLGTPLKGPFPDGVERRSSAMGCFWGAERIFWEAEGVYTTAVGYAGGITPNPTYEEVCSGSHRSHRGGAGGVRPDEDQLRGACCGSSGRATTPPRGCARATTWAPSTARRSLVRRCPARRRGGEPRHRISRRADGERLRRDHDRDLAKAGAVLLRRGLPPAVPGQEPRRLLRPRRHRRLVPGRLGGVAVAADPASTGSRRRR